MIIRHLVALAATAILIAVHGKAVAAPQILAVLPEADGVPFTCADGTCRTLLSTYCLQRHRPSPLFGTAYAPSDSHAFTLVVTDAAGAEHRIQAEGHVSFWKHSGYTSVAVSLSEAFLDERDAASVRLQVETNASLVPRPRADDPNPLSPAETTRAVGPLRALGRRIVDGRPEAATASLLSVFLGVSPSGHLGSREIEGLWTRLIEREPLLDRRPGARSRVRAEFGRCADAIAETATFDMRYCLEKRHEQLMHDLNVRYWDAQVGS